MCMGGKTHSKSYKPGDMRGRSGRCGGNPNTAVEVGFHLHRQPLRTVLRALASERSQGAGSHSVHKYSLSSVLLGTRLFFLLLLYFFLFRRLHIFLFQGCFFQFTVSGKSRSSEMGAAGRGMHRGGGGELDRLFCSSRFTQTQEGMRQG